MRPSGVALCFALLLTPGLALAQGTTFEAAPGATPAAAAEKPLSLDACRAELDTCEEHRAGVPYLAAAYIGLWLVLLVFLFMISSGQRKLSIELTELKERQKRLEAAGDPG